MDLDIHDLSHVLYVTIYDEDSNGRAEFLGKIALPLNELENHFIVKIALKVICLTVLSGLELGS